MNRLIQEQQGAVRLVRVAAQSAAGRELAARWGLRFTPSFVLFDAAGRQAWRGLGLPRAAELRAALQALPARE